MSKNVDLEARDIRHAYNTLEQIEASQYHLATLLHRLHYKSKAQHRSAKWFQSIDAIRKCYTRLITMTNVVSIINESVPDKGVARKAKLSRLQRKDDRIASIVDARVAISEVWDSLWGQSPLKGAEGLTKHDTPPQQEASSELCRIAALKIFIVCIQLEELACRSLNSFRLMQLHLRTPPAPTFAPLIMTILTLCARIYTTCQTLLWEKTNGETTLTSIYLRFCCFKQLGNPTSASFTLDAQSRKNAAAWAKMLIRVNQKKQKDLKWLPRELILPKYETRIPKVDVIPDFSVQHALAEETMIFEEDEDLGEAI